MLIQSSLCLYVATSIFEIPTIRMISETSDKNPKGEYSKLFGRPYNQNLRHSRSQYDDTEYTERSRDTRTEVDDEEEDEEGDGLDEDSGSFSRRTCGEGNESVHGEVHGRWHRVGPLHENSRNSSKPFVPCSSSMTMSSDMPPADVQPDYVTVCTNNSSTCKDNNIQNGTYQMKSHKTMHQPWLFAEYNAGQQIYHPQPYPHHHHPHHRRLYASRAYESADAIIQAVPIESPKSTNRSRPGVADSNEQVPVKLFPSSFDHPVQQNHKSQGSTKSVMSTIGDPSPTASTNSTFQTASNAPGPSPAHVAQTPSFHTVFGGTGASGNTSSGFTSPLSGQTPARVAPNTMLAAYQPYLCPTDYCFPYMPTDISQMNAPMFYATASQLSAAPGPSGNLIEERRTAAAAVAAAAAAAAASAAAAAAASLYYAPSVNPELMPPPLPSRSHLTSSCTSTASGGIGGTKPQISDGSQGSSVHSSACAFGPPGYMCAYLMPSGTGISTPAGNCWPRALVPPTYANADPRLCSMYQSMLSGDGPPTTVMETSIGESAADTLKRPVSNGPEGSTASAAGHTSTQSSSSHSKVMHDSHDNAIGTEKPKVSEASFTSGPSSESASGTEKPAYPSTYQEVAQWMHSVTAHSHSMSPAACYGLNVSGSGTAVPTDGPSPQWMVFLPYQAGSTVTF